MAGSSRPLRLLRQINKLASRLFSFIATIIENNTLFFLLQKNYKHEIGIKFAPPQMIRILL